MVWTEETGLVRSDEMTSEQVNLNAGIGQILNWECCDMISNTTQEVCELNML